MHISSSLSSMNKASENLEFILDDILTFVESESYSTDLPQLDKTIELVKKIFSRRLGKPDALKRFKSKIHGDAMLFRYDGKSSSTENPEVVTFIGHYDTVWPTGTIKNWGPRDFTDEAGRRVLSGPGIFDMKTGVVESIWVAKLLRQLDDYPTIQFLINGDEELGSPFSRSIIEDVASKSDSVLVFEASEQGQIKTARKGVGLITITATGIESHAGLEPTKGASAISALLEIGLQVNRLANLEKGTTVNIGLLSGGSGTNVVAGKATAKIDIRIEDPAERNRLDQALDSITWQDSRVKISIDRDWNRPPMVFTPQSQQLFARIEKAGKKLGKEVVHTAVGGASDANYVSALGVPVICGVGAFGGGAHARHEFIYPDELPYGIALLVETFK